MSASPIGSSPATGSSWRSYRCQVANGRRKTRGSPRGSALSSSSAIQETSSVSAYARRSIQLLGGASPDAPDSETCQRSVPNGETMPERVRGGVGKTIHDRSNVSKTGRLTSSVAYQRETRLRSTLGAGILASCSHRFPSVRIPEASTTSDVSTRSRWPPVLRTTPATELLGDNSSCSTRTPSRIRTPPSFCRSRRAMCSISGRGAHTIRNPKSRAGIAIPNSNTLVPAATGTSLAPAARSCFRKPGSSFLHMDLSSGQQVVQMAGLRHASPRHGLRREVVLLEHDNRMPASP